MTFSMAARGSGDPWDRKGRGREEGRRREEDEGRTMKEIDAGLRRGPDRREVKD